MPNTRYDVLFRIYVWMHALMPPSTSLSECCLDASTKRSRMSDLLRLRMQESFLNVRFSSTSCIGKNGHYRADSPISQSIEKSLRKRKRKRKREGGRE